MEVTVSGSDITVELGERVVVTSLKWRGAWATDTAYAVNDAVSRNGSSYVCTTAHTSSAPSAPPGANWTLAASKGDTGAAGAAGADGPAGPSNVITESSGPTSLSVGAVADGQFLKRVGSAVVGAAAASAAVDVTYSDLVTPMLSAANVQAALDAIKAILAARNLALYGDGSDGALSASSGNTNLSRPTYYTDVTLTSTATLTESGQPLFVSGTLDLSNAQAGAIRGCAASVVNGGNGVAIAAVGGAASTITNVATQQLMGSFASGAGALSSTTAGAQAAAVTAPVNVFGGASGAGGAGGAGSGGAGGASRAGASATATHRIRSFSPTLPRALNTASVTLEISSGASAPGGSGGGGNGTQNGSTGGGGGGCQQNVVIFARRIVVGPSTPAGVISCAGGNGGNGGNASAVNAGCGGGGGGGGGGLVYIVTNEVAGSAANAIAATGGAGGNGGTVVSGTGTGGNGGTGGAGGQIVIVNLSLGTITAVQGVAGSAGSVGSGGSGGTGGAGGACSASL